jgi:hypothetical protein
MYRASITYIYLHPLPTSRSSFGLLLLQNNDAPNCRLPDTPKLDVFLAALSFEQHCQLRINRIIPENDYLPTYPCEQVPVTRKAHPERFTKTSPTKATFTTAKPALGLANTAQYILTKTSSLFEAAGADIRDRRLEYPCEIPHYVLSGKSARPSEQ